MQSNQQNKKCKPTWPRASRWRGWRVQGSGKGASQNRKLSSCLKYHIELFLCLLWLFNPILPSTSCHPSLPHLIHGPQKLSPNQTHIPTQNLLNLPKEHTLWRTSSSSSFSPDDLIFILTWCTLVSSFSQDDPYISFSLDEPLKTVFWIAKSWMATLKASVRWFSFLVIITRIIFMKLIFKPTKWWKRCGNYHENGMNHEYVRTVATKWKCLSQIEAMIDHDWGCFILL